MAKTPAADDGERLLRAMRTGAVTAWGRGVGSHTGVCVYSMRWLMGITTYQDRVREEKAELDDRLRKLNEFVLHSAEFTQLPAIEQRLLTDQRAYMLGYSNALRQRIERFDLAKEATA